MHLDKSLSVLVFVWRNRRSRGLLLLTFFIFLFLGALANLAFNREDEPAAGSLQAVKCFDCAFEDTVRMAGDVETMPSCPKCRGRMGYHYKCYNCDFEFPFISRNSLGNGDSVNRLRGEFVDSLEYCPNCKSGDIYQISVRK